MKAPSSTRRWCAITADQRRSRTSDDRVPAALSALDLPGLALPFERTAGDEIQALAADAATVVTAVVRLTRVGGFRIGLGLGSVDEPLPASTREARGVAYQVAREAVSNHSAPLTLLADSSSPGVTDAETALLALVATLQRRSSEGWEVVDLIDSGLTGARAAGNLGITPSAVSQRLKAADHTLAARLEALSVTLLGQAMVTS